MAKKPDTAEALAKAEEARSRRDALQRAMFEQDDAPAPPAEVAPVAPPTPEPAPATAGAPLPEAHTAAEDGEDDKPATMEARAPARPLARRAAKPKQPSREATKPITVHLPPAVRQQLRVLSGETDRKIQDLVCEGLNLLFKRHGKEQIAPRDGK